MKYCRFQRGQCLLAYNDDEDKDRQWDHKRNHALRIWRSKDLQWGKRDLLGKMRPKCGPILELLKTPVVIFTGAIIQNMGFGTSNFGQNWGFCRYFHEKEEEKMQ